MNKNDAEMAVSMASGILKLYRDIAFLEKELRSTLSSSFDSQIDLCRALHLSPQYVNDILRGRRGISLDTLKSITKLKVEKQKQ